MDCFDNNLGNNIKNDAWNLEHNTVSGNFSRIINFAVFVDFTATSKINPRKSYYSIQMQ